MAARSLTCVIINKSSSVLKLKGSGFDGSGRWMDNLAPIGRIASGSNSEPAEGAFRGETDGGIMVGVQGWAIYTLDDGITELGVGFDRPYKGSITLTVGVSGPQAARYKVDKICSDEDNATAAVVLTNA